MLLIPHRRLVTMPGVAERHTEDPGTSLLARLRMKGRRSLEEVNLRLLPWCRVKNPYNPSALAQPSHETLHRLIAVAVAVLLHQVLPDTLSGEPRLQLLDYLFFVGSSQ